MSIAADEATPTPERYARYHWAAGVLRGRRVLDAACGGGWGTAVLAQTAQDAVGVDISPGAIAEARAAHRGTATFVAGDLRDLPFPDAEFDHVVCFEALAHLAEPERALDELRRVLCPAGALIVSAPNPAAYPAGNPLHLSTTPPEKLERLLRARFGGVAVHREYSYAASLLEGADTDDSDSSATEIRPRVVRIPPRVPGTELHAVGVASDGSLPAAPDWLVLGEDSVHGEPQPPIAQWQQRAVRAEAEVCALERKLRELQR